MAETLSEYDFTQSRRGAKPKYPWGTWSDGRIFRIQRGVDFQIECKSMHGVLRRHAASRGLVIRATSEDGDCIVFQMSNGQVTQNPPGKTPG